MPPIEPAFFWAAGLALPAEVAALFCYLRAIQVSPLSLTMPFMAFTPLFVIGTGWLFLDELPSVAGMSGVVLVVAGAYALNLHQVRRGWAAPMLAVTREKGSLLATGGERLVRLHPHLGQGGLGRVGTLVHGFALSLGTGPYHRGGVGRAAATGLGLAAPSLARPGGGDVHGGHVGVRISGPCPWPRPHTWWRSNA